jgi:hypothetical protein
LQNCKEKIAEFENARKAVSSKFKQFCELTGTQTPILRKTLTRKYGKEFFREFVFEGEENIVYKAGDFVFTPGDKEGTNFIGMIFQIYTDRKGFPYLKLFW